MASTGASEPADGAPAEALHEAAPGDERGDADAGAADPAGAAALPPAMARGLKRALDEAIEPLREGHRRLVRLISDLAGELGAQDVVLQSTRRELRAVQQELAGHQRPAAPEHAPEPPEGAAG